MIIKPPTPLENIDFTSSIFLAGSIDMGNAEDWQEKVSTAFPDAVVLNPRRDAWDASWKQSVDNPQFREQVLWELEALERAKVIACYFSPTSQAPISLLELGLHAHTGKLVVLCPEGYWRKGNVDIVCERYKINTVNSFEELIELCKKKL